MLVKGLMGARVGVSSRLGGRLAPSFITRFKDRVLTLAEDWVSMVGFSVKVNGLRRCELANRYLEGDDDRHICA